MHFGLAPPAFLAVRECRAACKSDHLQSHKVPDLVGLLQRAPKAVTQDPEVGMTKDQVVAMYGKTDNVQVSSEGETWIYQLNMGEAFIPFNFEFWLPAQDSDHQFRQGRKSRQMEL